MITFVVNLTGLLSVLKEKYLPVWVYYVLQTKIQNKTIQNYCRQTQEVAIRRFICFIINVNLSFISSHWTIPSQTFFFKATRSRGFAQRKELQVAQVTSGDTTFTELYYLCEYYRRVLDYHLHRLLTRRWTSPQGRPCTALDSSCAW